MTNHSFWNNPPWQGGTARYRLGLKPKEEGAPLLTPISDIMRDHKHAVLKSHYMKVVNVDPKCDAQASLSELRLRKPTQMYPDAIADFACMVDEDICLVDVADEHRLVAGCMCSPSYWRLPEKIGLPLFKVHAAATGVNETIGVRIAQFIDRMPVEKTFGRKNWFLHGNAGLFQYEDEPALGMPVEGWVMRCETQTLYKINPRFMLFGIQIVCEPLRDILRYPVAVKDLLVALARMSGHEVEHFGGSRKHAMLRDWLQTKSDSSIS